MKRRNFLWYSLLFVAGCTAGTSNPTDSSSNSGTGGSLEKLRFSISDTQGMEELQREYEPFRKALEEVLEKKIEFFPLAKGFAGAGSALQLNQVDLLLTGPSEYVIIRARTNAVPIIGLSRPGFRSVIAVRAGSKIKSLAQLKGKTIAMREVGSTSGHIIPTKMLIDAGLNPQSDFKIVMTADNGLQALKNRQADAWAVSIFRYKRTILAEGLSENAFPVIATGPLLPNDLFVASSKLEPALIEEIRTRMLKNQDKLTQALLATKVASTRFRGSQLVPVNDKDYDIIRKTYKAIGEGDFS